MPTRPFHSFGDAALQKRTAWPAASPVSFVRSWVEVTETSATPPGMSDSGASITVSARGSWPAVWVHTLPFAATHNTTARNEIDRDRVIGRMCMRPCEFRVTRSFCRRKSRRTARDGSSMTMAGQEQDPPNAYPDRGGVQKKTGPALRSGLPVRVMIAASTSATIASMLNELSTQMADAVDAVAASVVQVQGHRRPASGLVYGDGLVLTTMRALGGDDGLHVRRADGTVLDAELAGWDPATTLAVLRVGGLSVPPLQPGSTPPRVGHLVLALARSWSNSVTASAGIISVIGGPLPTGRRRAIDQVIRTTAPLHDGFSGGALIDAAGALLG